MNPVEYYRKNADGSLELIAQEDMYQNHRFPVGHTLVTVEKNSTQYQYSVNPDTVALVAAAQSLQSQLTTLLMEAAQPRQMYKYTPEQLAAWQQLKETGIEQLWFPSPYVIAQQFLNSLVAQAASVTHLPWVQEAQERYQQALALALEPHE